MTANRNPPHLQPLTGAVNIQHIPADQLEHVNQALREGKLIIQTITHQGRSQTYVGPVVEKES